MSNAQHDENHVPTLIAVSSADGLTPTLLYADPVTHRLLTGNVASNGFFNYTQVGASANWAIAHNLGTKNLVVSTYDSLDEPLVYNDITFVDNNNIIINFTSPVTGRAVILSAGGAGGGTVPGGADTNVQFNDSGAFGGDADFTWNKTTNTLGFSNPFIVTTGGARFITNTGTGDTLIGENTSSLTSTVRMTTLGYHAGNTLASNNDGVCIGHQACELGNPSFGIYIGGNAGRNSTSTGNIAIGYTALESAVGGVSGILAIGGQSQRFNVGGSVNTSVGIETLRNHTGPQNVTVMGHRAMVNQTSGGAQNSVFGTSALQNSTGNNNVAIGYTSGNILTTGGNNTFVGTNANATSVSQTNSTAIGYNAVVTADNTIQLGDTNITDVITSGNVTLKTSLQSSGVLALSLISHVADSGTNVGIVLNNTTSLTSSGRRLINFNNNGTPEAWIDSFGQIFSGSNGSCFVSGYNSGNFGVMEMGAAGPGGNGSLQIRNTANAVWNNGSMYVVPGYRIGFDGSIGGFGPNPGDTYIIKTLDSGGDWSFYYDAVETMRITSNTVQSGTTGTGYYFQLGNGVNGASARMTNIGGDNWGYAKFQGFGNSAWQDYGLFAQGGLSMVTAQSDSCLRLRAGAAATQYTVPGVFFDSTQSYDGDTYITKTATTGGNWDFYYDGGLRLRIDATNNSLTNPTRFSDGIQVKEAANQTMGVTTLSGGTQTISTTKVTANSRIFLTTQGGTLTNVGSPYISARTAGTSFVITSSNVLDTSDVAWLIVEPF